MYRHTFHQYYTSRAHKNSCQGQRRVYLLRRDFRRPKSIYGQWRKLVSWCEPTVEQVVQWYVSQSNYKFQNTFHFLFYNATPFICLLIFTLIHQWIHTYCVQKSFIGALYNPFSKSLINATHSRTGYHLSLITVMRRSNCTAPIPPPITFFVVCPGYLSP